MADKQIAVRLVVQGGDKTKTDLRGIGVAGDQAMTQITRSSKSASAALRSTTADMSRMGSISRSSGAAIQNASYQVGDFFVQIASGTGAMRAAAQQLPQLLGGFGLWGAVAGGVVAAGAALVPMFMDAGDGATSVDDAVENLSSTMAAYRQAVEDLNAPMGEMYAKFGQNTVAAREVRQALLDIARVRLSDAFAAIGAGVDDQLSDLRDLVAEYRQIQSGDAQTPGMEYAAAEAQRDIIAEIKDEWGMTYTEAARVSAAVDGYNQALRAGNEQEKAVALGEMSAALADALDNGIGLSDEMKSLVESVSRAAIEQMELASQTDNAATAAGNAESAILGALGATGDWAAAMSGVAAEISGIASALSSIGGSAIASAGKYVELNALKAGRDIAGAARARREVEMRAEFDAREAAAGNIVERLLVRGERSLAMNGLDVDAQLEAARASARDAMRSSGGARGGARGGSGGGRSATGGYDSTSARTGEQIDRLRAEAAAFAAAAVSSGQYGDAMDFARKKAELLAAAQKDGKAVTPELTAEIDRLAQSYALAAQEAEATRDRMEGMQRQADLGRDAMSNIFGAVLEGSDAAKRAVADLLMEIAKIQFQKAAMGALGGADGTGGGLFSFLGGLLSMDGGGWTGNGARSGGLDGRGGFLAMMHPQERVIDTTKGHRGGAGGGGQAVVRVELGPNLVASILQQAGAQSVQLVQAADKRLPERMAQINSSPRRRG